MLNFWQIKRLRSVLRSPTSRRLYNTLPGFNVFMSHAYCSNLCYSTIFGGNSALGVSVEDDFHAVPVCIP